MTKRNDKEILAAFHHMAVNELGGSCQQMTTSNSMGRTSKKIVIEYDVQQTK